MANILDNKDMRNQMHYLFQNVFQKPSYISVDGPCLEPRLKALTDGLPNWSRLKLKLYEPDICNNDTIRMILDWLSNDKCVAKNLQRDTGKKHLVLQSFPRRFILNLVQQIKDAFNDETLLFSDFVITFSSSDENRLCLEGDHTFILNRISTNERLSFFTYNHFPGSDDYSGLVYRLWCRRVVNEAEDLKMALHLQNLEKSFSLGIDFCDQQFYDFFSFSLAKLDCLLENK
ncbi:hypothetical protein Ddc_14881 [Ditylenchus destructor]|nr:hypothetical protein Ddc_14881 [Ditylenchus destructor]